MTASFDLLEQRSWLNRKGVAPADAPMPSIPWPDPTPSPRLVDAEAEAKADRAALRDDLFGAGFQLPGGALEIVRLVKPLHLSTSARLLIAGIGVGGPVVTIAKRLGLFVSGYDRETLPELAVTPGSRLADSTHAALWEIDEVPLPQAAYHHAVALMPLTDGPSEPVLAQLTQALRPTGNLLLLEYVVSSDFSPDAEDSREWMRLEQRTSPPPVAEDISRALARLGMRLRDIEDLSNLHARLAVYAWRGLIDKLPGRPEELRGHSMLREAEIWAHRVRMIRQGKLRLIRWHCVLPSASDPAPLA